ncbi:MAG: glutathione S-transferase family protein [Candidatus Puniceispirillaceae bacterium]
MASYKVMGRSVTGSFFVECLLREAGIAYEFIHVSRGDSKSDAFAEINPLARVPVLILPDGRHIIETVAIFIHLMERFPALAPAADTPERDLMWQHLAVMATSLYPSLHRFHHTHYYAPEAMFEAVRDKAIEDGDRWWDYLESQLAPFLGGAAPGSTDFYLFMMTRWAPDRDRMLAGRPQLSAFIDNMRAHPTVDAVTQSHARPRGC